MMKKKISGLVLLAALLFVLLPASVHAAKYEGERLDDGSVNVVNADTGEALATLSLRLGTVNTQIAVSGDWIYFTGSVTNYTDYSVANSLYAYNYKTEEQLHLKALPAAFDSYDVNDVYGGSVYLTGWTGSDDTALYRWNLQKKTLKKVAEDGYALRYKRYIVCESTMVHGAFTLYPIYVYNTRTGKVVTAMKKVGGYGYKGGKLYIAQMPKEAYPETKKAAYKIIQYDIATGAKKTLNRKVKAYLISKMTNKYIYHQGSDQETHTSYFYRTAIKTGKTVRLSKEKYFKALGFPLPEAE